MAETDMPDGPRPVPPEPPGPNECCESGCDPCVHDLYADALREYRAALSAWEKRRAGAAAPPRRDADPTDKT
ncbi:oxidoreductase-like domain-containing protein [Paracandidimonas soli]|uniref:Oxidoreductase family protein n=1 Tax=Paracandidimonas soli TaxID=1917182 RepID=A0A4R3V4N3_9BURK|nr:oxidoreductase-like domain-containing protein [Paracandidimonas soli]TCU98532.1 oxidoreductase family protein [Paracandidimonas soli]